MFHGDTCIEKPPKDFFLSLPIEVDFGVSFLQLTCLLVVFQGRLGRSDIVKMSYQFYIQSAFSHICSLGISLLLISSFDCGIFGSDN